MPQLVEIFHSIQGEGVFVGVPTIFVRFGGCDLRCAWCDSPETWTVRPECRSEVESGTGEFVSVLNPVTVDWIEERVRELAGPATPAVSLTGGEPLLQAEAVAELAARLRRAGHAIHLETHGLAVEALDGVLPHCDAVAMDWKLTSDVRRESDPRGTPAAPFDEAHVRFLARVAKSDAAVFVKIVVTASTTQAELEKAARLVGEAAPGTALVLQPVTPFASVREGPRVPELLAAALACQRWLADVRVIPQTHRLYGAL